MPKIKMLIQNSKTGKVHHEELEGTTVIIPIGSTRIRFLIHHSRNRQGGTDLTHIDSGMCVGSLNGAKSDMAVRRGLQLTNREAALHLIDMLVERFGEVEVLRRLNEAPKIN